MIALAGTFGRFHLAQKCVHFRQSQAPVGAYRAVAGHRRQHVVGAFLDAPRLAVDYQIAEHIAGQARVGTIEQPG